MAQVVKAYLVDTESFQTTLKGFADAIGPHWRTISAAKHKTVRIALIRLVLVRS